MTKPGKSGRAGFALSVVLVVCAILAGVMLPAVLRARVQRLSAINAATDIRTRAAARAGIAQATAELQAIEKQVSAPDADASELDAWNRPDTLIAVPSDTLPGGAAYQITIEDLSGRMPLNAASANELRDLLLSLGAARADAEANASLIIQARDSAAFGVPEDLDRLSLTGLPHGWQSYLTTLGDGRVNINTAPVPVLSALPGFSPEAVAAILDRRAQQEWLHSPYELAGLCTGEARARIQANFVSLSSRISFLPLAIAIDVDGTLPGSPLVSRITATATRGGVFRVLSVIER